MTESEWLKGTDPDGMIQVVRRRLTPRRWHLLACGLTRRVLDLLPEQPIAKMLDELERSAGEVDPAWLETRRAEIDALEAEVMDRAEALQREIVATADPDTPPEEFVTANEGRSNPHATMFRSASTNAAQSIQFARSGARQALTAFERLHQPRPGMAMLEQVREAVLEASISKMSANVQANVALDLKARGEEVADRSNGKRHNVICAAVEETVRKIHEQTSYKLNDVREKKERSERKLIARILLEIIGNPYKRYRFDKSWRSDTVVQLAQSIDTERAFDRMPILADALLDVDCDEESVLRHCRGTEQHAPSEGVIHYRGCWVIDLILQREPAMFRAKPISPPKPPPPTPMLQGDSRSREDEALRRIFQAIRQGTPPPDDEE